MRNETKYLLAVSVTEVTKLHILCVLSSTEKSQPYGIYRNSHLL